MAAQEYQVYNYLKSPDGKRNNERKQWSLEAYFVSQTHIRQGNEFGRVQLPLPKLHWGRCMGGWRGGIDLEQAGWTMKDVQSEFLRRIVGKSLYQFSWVQNLKGTSIILLWQSSSIVQVRGFWDVHYSVRSSDPLLHLYLDNNSNIGCHIAWQLSAFPQATKNMTTSDSLKAWSIWLQSSHKPVPPVHKPRSLRSLLCGTGDGVRIRSLPRALHMGLLTQWHSNQNHTYIYI